MADSLNLTDMKLPELKELAKQMGLRGTSTMRKSELLATLQAARSGGEAPAGVTVRVAAGPVDGTAGATGDAADRNTHDEAPKEAAVDAGDEANDPVDGTEGKPSASARRGKMMSLDAIELPEPHDRAARPKRERDSRDGHDARDTHESHGTGALDLDLDLPRVRRRKDGGSDASRAERARELGDILAALPERNDRDHDHRTGKRGRDERRMERQSRESRYDREDDDDMRRGRDRRNNRDERRGRGRENAGHGREEVQQEELVPVAGIIDVLDSYAFVRTSGYLPGPNDVYVSMGQVKKYGLRKGDAVQGTTRPPREGRSQRQKFVPLQSIETINGMSVEEAQQRPHFNKLTPLYPQERLRMETQPNKLIGRLIDIFAPIGKGQRGLIVSPPKAGKTITLQNIANSITTNNPEVHLMVVLVDERPEEVTDMERTVQGEVISSTFDRPASDHTIVAELAIERAKRLVELGQDVVVLLDSMTRLARAYNIAQPASGRILSGGVDAQALYPPKKFFGAARNIENGGSLTIISSALVETGSKMDEVIFEEFKGTGNMELRLSRDLADKRLFPAVDINASGTRREELITPPTELAVVYRLRRLLGGMEPEQAYQTMVPRLKKTATNHEFLAGITSSMQQAKQG